MSVISTSIFSEPISKCCFPITILSKPFSNLDNSVSSVFVEYTPSSVIGYDTFCFPNCVKTNGLLLYTLPSTVNSSLNLNFLIESNSLGLNVTGTWT